MLRKLGGGDPEIEHTETRKRQREDTLARSVKGDREAIKAALD